jgi:dolichol-phosphate mannosyltransferase
VPLEVQSLAEWERMGVKGMLSVLIPAHDEAGHIEATVRALDAALSAAGILHEILVVNDNSSDGTREVLERLERDVQSLRFIDNDPPHGYGWAVRCGLASFRGEAVVIVMADASDDPADVVAFYRALEQGVDCVYGSRFVAGGSVSGYRLPKLLLNRLGNTFIRLLFWMRYNDVTNAFKMFRRSVIAGIQPLLSQHFNLTVELPLKAIARGYSYAVVPNRWYNREHGKSSFGIKEMGSRYVFIILYCWLEMMLSRGDYSRDDSQYPRQLQVWPK